MAILCHCHGLSHRVIRRAVEDGARTIADVGAECRAGTLCAGCHPSIDEVIDETVSRLEHNHGRRRIELSSA